MEDLLVADAASWRAWLEEHHGEPTGVWLVLARVGGAGPTTLTYAEALDEALCLGWVDGQVRAGDGTTYSQRFTPRRARSLWSARNVTHVARLTAAGRMHPAGLAEVERAKADGRWDRAYAGSATIEVPPELSAALAAVPGAAEAFAALSRGARYSALHGIATAVRPETRVRRAAAVVESLGL